MSTTTAAQQAAAISSRWVSRLREFLPGWIASVPALRAVSGDLDVVLHGSTCLGIDDAWSDIDLWGFVSAESLARADSLSPTRFYEFKIDGKPGHLNLEMRDEAMARVRNCQLERIAELRRSVLLKSCGDWADEMLSISRRPMSREVRETLAMHHYIEMRSEHRTCDTPIERGEYLALLLAMGPFVSHALRCAMVLDGEPYPYSKWLGRAASATPTGVRVHTLCQQLLAIIGQDGLRQSGPERSHPVSLKMREIRAVMIESARSAGIDRPWLTHWWLYMTQAKEGMAAVRWC